MNSAAWVGGEEPLAFRAHLAPALVIGSSVAARARGVAEVEAAGLRLAAAVPVEQAVDRLAVQAAASALWVELDRDDGEPLDRLLDRIDAEADSGRCGVVVHANTALIDPLSARLANPRIEWLVDANPADRAAALAIALSSPEGSARLSDVAGDGSAARLRQLSEDVSRIAATLARLSQGPATGDTPRPTALGRPDAEPGEVNRDQVRAVIRARRLRARHFSADLFADPAWDMLLDLMQAEIGQVRVPVSSLCIAAAVPATTALRWIKTLTDEGIFVRRADPHDGRRVFVEMAAGTSRAMRAYFNDVGPITVI